MTKIFGLTVWLSLYFDMVVFHFRLCSDFLEEILCISNCYCYVALFDILCSLLTIVFLVVWRAINLLGEVIGITFYYENGFPTPFLFINIAHWEHYYQSNFIVYIY